MIFLYKSAQAELKTHQKKALFEPILFIDMSFGHYLPLYHNGKTWEVIEKEIMRNRLGSVFTL